MLLYTNLVAVCLFLSIELQFRRCRLGPPVVLIMSTQTKIIVSSTSVPTLVTLHQVKVALTMVS